MFGGYTGLGDMVNGGGAGRSGNTFEGGPMSGLLNAIGVRPMGYSDRQEQAMSTRPRQRPAMPMQGGGMQPMQGGGMQPMRQPMQQPMMPMYAQPAPQTPDQMLMMLQQAIKSAPQPRDGMSREQLVNMMRGYY
jgi:hypothetical protein